MTPAVSATSGSADDPEQATDDVRVGVIVVNYRTSALLPGCLDAYLAQDHPALDIIVIDNASGDGSREVLDDYVDRQRQVTVGPTLTAVVNEDNRGFCGALNDGLAICDAPVVVFSNVDVRPRPDLISTALRALLADGRRGTVQPKLLRDDLGQSGPASAPPQREARKASTPSVAVAAPAGDAGLAEARIDTTGHVMDRARLVANRDEGCFDDGSHEVEGEVFGASGALVMHRRAMLDDICWQDSSRGEVLTEDLFAFFDDVELDWRARRFGWTAWYEPRAVARHQRGGAGARRTWRVEALNFSNRLLVVATCDDRRRLLRAGAVFAMTTALKAAELLVTSPRGFAYGFVRVLRGLPAALRRRAELHRRASVDAAAVIDRWCTPFDGKRWVATWWRRTRPRR